MGNTNADGIWTPDEDDTMEPDVYLPMMAESISQGLGKRMALQETRVSLRATAPDTFTVTGTGGTTGSMQVPLSIAGVTNSRSPDPDFAGGNHAEGILMEGGWAKIVTPGLYTLTGQVSLLPSGGAEHAWDFWGTVNGGIFGLPDYGTTSMQSYVGGRVSDTRVLAKDDMIALTVSVGTDHVGAVFVQDCLLTIAMHYAIPET